MTARSAPPSAQVLIVEDKDSLRTMLRHALEGHGHAAIEARDEPEAIRLLQRSRPTVVLSDLRLPHGSGFGVLRAVKELDPNIPVIVMTAYGSIEDAVAAMKEGALDFLAKPVDPAHLLLLVDRAIDRQRMITENILLKEELGRHRGFPEIVGQGPTLMKVLSSLQRVAGTETTVLLEGESGTGKELFARALHAFSPRADGPFVAINCAAIPDALLESELFGYERGAFTGAVARKLGKFEVADRGTLFLDEIGDMPLGLQGKILRALEERSFERVGGVALLHVDVRLVAATNHNLRASVAARRFREDLFFRLSVFPITIPPLRERPGDIALLADRFLDRLRKELKRRMLTLSTSAVEAMQRYNWPGNVRELQNCLERAAILVDGDTIHPQDLSLSLPVPSAEVPADADPWDELDLSGSLAEASRRILAEVERRKIQQALREASSNKGRTAEILQISTRMLGAKLREYQLE